MFGQRKVLESLIIQMQIDISTSVEAFEWNKSDAGKGQWRYGI